VTRAAAAALAVVLALAGAGPARAAALDYLHVEANSGGSSGGHAALRLGDTVFEFQHGEGGTLRLRRSRWEAFRYRTAVRGNRTIHAARIALPEAESERLRRAFDARALVSGRHFAVLEALRGDRRLLESLAAGAATPAVEGAGLFEPPGAGAGGSAALLALRERVARRYGAGFVAARLRALEASLAALAPEASAGPPPALDPERLPRAPYAFSERRRDLAQWVAALRALAGAAPLREEALRAGSPAPALDDAEARGLAAWAGALEESLAALAGSQRPEGGLALLVGMARLEATRRSLAEGRLRLLDDLPRDADAVPPGAELARDPYLAARREAAAARLARARGRLAAPGAWRETDYDALEEAGNDVLELDAARAGAAPLRLADGERIPAPAAVVDDLPAPALDPPALRRALAAARARERGYERALGRALGYRLLTRNCVTELFATIAAAGGPAAPPGRLDFVPFVSYDAVVASWPVSGRWQEPALRRARLAAMYAAENDLRVYLRESNTLTSTIYRRGPRDGFFLFFTDDAPPLRPLLGAANLVAAAGESLLGIARLPFDRGATLRDGLAGALYSLPELAFANIRKGTLRYGPPPGAGAALAPVGAPAAGGRELRHPPRP